MKDFVSDSGCGFNLKNISQIAYELPTKSKWCVELTVYQGQLHLVTFLRGHQVQIMCAPVYIYTVKAWCAVEKTRTRSQLLTMLFFFWIKEKLQLLKLKFGSEKWAERWEFGLWT